MKYQLALLVLAVVSVQRIAGDSPPTTVWEQAEQELEHVLKPMLNEGKELLDKLKKMQDSIVKINPNTQQCKDLKTSLKAAEATVQELTKTAASSSLKIKQEIIQLKNECSHVTGGTIMDVMYCIEQHMGDVNKMNGEIQKDIVDAAIVVRDISMKVENEFQLCMKSQLVSPKPKV